MAGERLAEIIMDWIPAGKRRKSKKVAWSVDSNEDCVFLTGHWTVFGHQKSVSVVVNRCTVYMCTLKSFPVRSVI
jgi:hypothetical protein